MTWRPLDCHAHTVLSDGELTVAELVEQVAGRGVRPSVSDHLSRDVNGGIGSVEGVERYIDELEQHAVMRAGEFCWHDTLWRELPGSLVRRFTHRIGSLHAVWLADGRLLHVFSSPYPAELAPATYLEAHVANAERLGREMPVDVLAHPTLLPLPLRALPPEELWSEALEERLVEALARAGIAFEISNRYRPHERLVRRAVARGVRLSLGSDGHVREAVGDVAWPLAFARLCGAAPDALYDPLAHGSRTGA